MCNSTMEGSLGRVALIPESIPVGAAVCQIISYDHPSKLQIKLEARLFCHSRDVPNVKSTFEQP